MLALLARVSSYAPLADLTGPALEVERQWLELERLGRPSDHGTWANEVWYAVEIVRAKEDEFIATLQHGWPYLKERNNSRFKIVCNDST